MKLILLTFLTILIMCGTCHTFNANWNLRKTRQIGVINFSDIFGKSLARQAASYPTEHPVDNSRTNYVGLHTTQKPVAI